MTGRDVAATIVVMEDSDEDYDVLARVLLEVRPDLVLDRVSDGLELVERIERDAPGLAARLALFDVNLPGRDGLDVLRAWRAHPLLSAVPVVVLSGSARADEVDECYRRGAAGYLAKPFGVAAYRQAVGALITYWFETTMPPPLLHPLSSRSPDIGRGEGSA